MHTHAKTLGLTFDPQLCVMICVLVVASDFWVLTTNWVFMHDWFHGWMLWSIDYCVTTFMPSNYDTDFCCWFIPFVCGSFLTFAMPWKMGSNDHVGWDNMFKMFQHDEVDLLLCSNHLTYVLLLLLLFALLILLGDMCYLCHFMNITFCSLFYPKKSKGGDWGSFCLVALGKTTNV